MDFIKKNLKFILAGAGVLAILGLIIPGYFVVSAGIYSTSTSLFGGGAGIDTVIAIVLILAIAAVVALQFIADKVKNAKKIELILAIVAAAAAVVVLIRSFVVLGDAKSVAGIFSSKISAHFGVAFYLYLVGILAFGGAYAFGYLQDKKGVAPKATPAA